MVSAGHATDLWCPPSETHPPEEHTHASFHLGREQDALKHKSAAISLLSNSIQSPYQNKMAQFATCMMLCVYSVSLYFVFISLQFLFNRTTEKDKVLT